MARWRHRSPARPGPVAGPVIGPGRGRDVDPVLLTGVRHDGDEWVECGQGHRHWGRFGAAGLLIRDRVEPPGRVVLQHRAPWSHHGDTWGLPGGARDSHETPVQTALREASEEAGVAPEHVRADGTVTDDHGGWAYTTVLAEPAGPLDPRPTGGESTQVRWVPVDEVGSLPLHPGFAATWPRLRAIPPGLTIVIDAANVVGSRPDGWWRDRPGAARRLRDSLTPLAAGLPAADLPAAVAAPVDADVLIPRLLLIVEGAAKVIATDPPTGADPAPIVLAADGSGDDAIMAAAAEVGTGRRVLAVTADRGLIARLATVGVPRVGPGWLLDRIGDPVQRGRRGPPRGGHDASP